MQHFMIPCDFGGRKAPFPIYVGEPKPDSHPLHHQSWWLSSERGGSIPQEVMDSFEKLHKIAMENNVSFEELCVYAMGEATASQDNAAPPPPPEEVQYEEPQAQMQPAVPQQQEDVFQPVENPFAAPQQPAQQQPYSQQHQPQGSHQERVESYEQNPNDPYRNNQS